MAIVGVFADLYGHYIMVADFNLNHRVNFMPHRSHPVVAKKGPYVVELEASKTYYWCTCGRSETQPFCDGSHKGTNFEPLKVEVSETKKYGLCGCKHTKNAPFCDREHSKL